MSGIPCRDIWETGRLPPTANSLARTTAELHDQQHWSDDDADSQSTGNTVSSALVETDTVEGVDKDKASKELHRLKAFAKKLDRIDRAIAHDDEDTDMQSIASDDVNASQQQRPTRTLITSGEPCSIPVHIIMIFRLDTIPKPITESLQHNVHEPGYYMLCHRTPGPLKDQSQNEEQPHTKAVMFQQASKVCDEVRLFNCNRVQPVKKLVPRMFVQPVSTIRRPCIAVPDVEVESDKPGSVRVTFQRTIDHSYIFVAPKTLWPTLYMHKIMKRVEEKDSAQRNTP